MVGLLAARAKPKVGTAQDMNFKEGEWVYSSEHHEAVRVIEAVDLWDHSVYRIFIPSREAVVRVAEAKLLPLSLAQDQGSARFRYVVAAARVAEAMGQDGLLAPIEGNIEPLPHQIHAISRAVEGPRVRFLLADEVGLGKTIEA